MNWTHDSVIACMLYQLNYRSTAMNTLFFPLLDLKHHFSDLWTIFINENHLKNVHKSVSQGFY